MHGSVVVGNGLGYGRVGTASAGRDKSVFLSLQHPPNVPLNIDHRVFPESKSVGVRSWPLSSF
jgi:hypothetical protein